MKRLKALIVFAFVFLFTTASGAEQRESEKLYIGIQGGVSSFLSTSVRNPFDRLSPNLNISVGLWATPNVGLRAKYEGLSFESYKHGSLNYGAFHLDILVNPLNIIKEKKDRRWDVVPYFGVGVAYNEHKPGGFCTICNEDPHTNHPFSIFYGVQGRYKVSEDIHVTAEFGDLSTFQSFDGYGSASHFGDHLLTISAGMTYTFNFKKKKKEGKSCKTVAPEVTDCCHRKGETIILVRDSTEILSETISFDDNSVIPSGRREIEKVKTIADKINETDGDIEISCSADMYVTDATKRYHLARTRAKNVAATLIRYGVDERRIYIKIKAYERKPDANAIVIRFIQ